jgi:uncharacterized protein YceH (UPF0502 family)
VDIGGPSPPRAYPERVPDGLEARVGELEGEVAALRAQLEELRRSLGG